MLPQEDPVSNLMLLKSYNVPELTREPISYSTEQLKEAIYTQVPGTDIKYRELRTPEQISTQRKQAASLPDEQASTEATSAGQPTPTDAQTGASPKADAQTGASPKAK